jgi:hypothetical protein
VADELAEKLTLLVVLVVAGVKVAVTPVGRLVAARVTGALKFSALRTLMVALTLLPSMTLRVLADEVSVKLGVGTVTVTVAEAVNEPEVPVMVTVCGPGVAVAPAVKDNVLDEALLAGLKLAVMPLGRPVAVKLTEPVKPFAAATLILEVAALPPIGADKVADADDIMKLGVGTVRLMFVELVMPPTVPVILTA